MRALICARRRRREQEQDGIGQDRRQATAERGRWIECRCARGPGSQAIHGKRQSVSTSNLGKNSSSQPRRGKQAKSGRGSREAKPVEARQRGKGGDLELTIGRINGHEILHGRKHAFRQLQGQQECVILFPDVQITCDLAEELHRARAPRRSQRTIRWYGEWRKEERYTPRK